MCHSISRVYPFPHTSSLTDAHCNESLVWIEISGFCDTNIGSSLGLLRVILLLYPAASGQQAGLALLYFPRVHRDIDLGVGQLNWLVCQLSHICTTIVSSPALLWLGHPTPPLTGGRVNSPVFIPLGQPTLTCASRASSAVLPSQSVEPTF